VSEGDILLSERTLCNAFIERLAGPNNPNGVLIVAAVMEFCGANEQDPTQIKPDLVAFQNWFLSRLGVRVEKRGLLQDGESYRRFTAEAQALMGIANTDDIDRRVREAEYGGSSNGNEDRSGTGS